MAGGGVFFAAEALVGVKKRCWRVGVSCGRAMARGGAVFSSVTDAAVCKRLPRVRGRWRCVFTSRSASGIVAARGVRFGVVQCRAMPRPRLEACVAGVEQRRYGDGKERKENNKVGARSEKEISWVW